MSIMRSDDANQVRPLLSGQFQSELTSHFTDWFRQLVFTKPVNADGQELR
jgi:hypothetical protein